MHRPAAIAWAVFLLLPAATRASSLGDKALHGLAGASCSLITCAVVSYLSSPQPVEAEACQRALLVAASGLGSAALAGIAKELSDLRGFGRAEWLDLAAVLAGGLAASSLVLAASCLAGKQLAPVYASFGVVFAIPPGQALLKRLFGGRSGASSD